MGSYLDGLGSFTYGDQITKGLAFNVIIVGLTNVVLTDILIVVGICVRTRIYIPIVTLR